MEFDLNRLEDVLKSIHKAEKELISSKENIISITTQIKKNWKSVASDQFCTNMKKTMEVFQTYIDELNNCYKYIDSSISDITSTEKANISLIEGSF